MLATGGIHLVREYLVYQRVGSLAERAAEPVVMNSWKTSEVMFWIFQPDHPKLAGGTRNRVSHWWK
jgi:hypothetical protein